MGRYAEVMSLHDTFKLRNRVSNACMFPLMCFTMSSGLLIADCSGLARLAL